MKHMVKIKCEECGAEGVAVVQEDGTLTVRHCYGCVMPDLNRLAGLVEVRRRQRIEEKLCYATGARIIRG